MSWLTRLLRRRTLERDLERELRFHLEAAADDHVRAGLPRDEAMRRARLELGGLERVKEATRDARGTRWVEDWWTDTRYALRAMARSPGFSAAAVLTLALGIGANTAVWSITDALMRRSLPIDRPEELHAVRKAGIEDASYLMSHALMQRLQAAVGDSVRIAGMGGVARLYATVGDRPEGVIAQLVSGTFFPLLGVRAQVGRLLGPEDDRTLGGGPVAVLTEGYWERQFGRDPSVVGRTIRVNGAPLTVVGVAESGFTGLTVGQGVDLYAPLAMQHELRYKPNASASNSDTEKPWVPQNGVSWLTLVTRIPPRAAPALAARLDGPFRADLEQVMADRDSAGRAYAMREHVALEPIARGFSPLREQFAEPLRVLMAGVALVLLIACANLAGLLLARAAARTHEIAIRASLGAQPGRLVRQAVTESLTLAAVGGAFGVLVAHGAIRALLRLASTGTRAIPLDAAVDGRVLAFAFALTLVAGLLFGLAPAMRVARANLYDGFKTGGRVAGAGPSRLPLGRALVTAQIALSLVLVTSAGVLVRSFRNLLRIEAGYERETVVNARLDVRAAGYGYAQLPAVYDALIRAARAVPGVRSASLSLHGLGSGARRTSGFTVPGRVIAPPGNVGQESYVTPDFFRTVGIPLVRGRGFTERDGPDAPKVVVLSQTAAKRFFGSDSAAVGARFGYGTPPELEVVGVVRDVRANGLREPPPPMVFRALAQGPQEYVTSLEVRVAGPAASVVGGLRNAIAGVNPDLPVRDVGTLEDILGRGLTTERLVARLAGSFGALALLLAAIGLYGVISYSVTRRTNEMGVRLALGATPGRVLGLVLGDSLRTIAAGLVVGLALWFPLLGLARRLLYGVSPHDPVTLATGAAVLLGAGLLAGFLPARRASRIDPIRAIRSE